ncbi:MAG TPA: hypothetical protein VFD89_03505, partial [Clostridia bacterium]|nr:hypothetical protein [Clostridia bacterium]
HKFKTVRRNKIIVEKILFPGYNTPGGYSIAEGICFINYGENYILMRPSLPRYRCLEEGLYNGSPPTFV